MSMKRMRKMTQKGLAQLAVRLKGLLADEVCYIGGSETLPPPLNAEEEAELLKHLGEDEGARAVLIERNLRLVVYIARKFENTNVGIEDLISIGSIGLIKAINTFKPDRNIKLATYASRCIENEILMYLRKNQNARSEISIDEPLNVDWDGNELLLSDILSAEGDSINQGLEEEVDRELLNTAIGKLPAREQKIMQLRYGLGGRREFTQKEVAAMLGISQSYISRLEKRIILRLKKEIMKMN